MKLVGLYSGLLLLGILISQFVDLSMARDFLTTLTMICLAYIMIEVGFEFTIDKKNLKSYGWDYVVAMTAAAFPWVFCSIYFMTVLNTSWQEAWLVGRFAAPTSAGILFTMLAAAGLGMTWLFKKVRVLAIFDDLDTVLLMIPLKMMMVGLKPQLFGVLLLIAVLLFAAYKWMHVLRLPAARPWMLGYGLVIALACEWLDHSTKIHLEVLLPAFVMGCILWNPHDPAKPQEHEHEHAFLEPESKYSQWLDRLIKGSFMLLVGCSLPKMNLEGLPLGALAGHVIVLTILSNIGKCFPILCYRKEASLKERIATAVAMFPRGEVGAGVLLVAIGYGIEGTPIVLAGLSLALNLLLTGIFITIVIRMLGMPSALKKS